MACGQARRSCRANLDGAQESKQFGSANRTLELIGRVTGLVGSKHQEPQVPISRVTIVLNHGADHGRNPEIVEATEYRELPGPRKDTRRS